MDIGRAQLTRQQILNLTSFYLHSFCFGVDIYKLIIVITSSQSLKWQRILTSLLSLSLAFPFWLLSSHTENPVSTRHSAMCWKVGEGSQSWLVRPFSLLLLQMIFPTCHVPPACSLLYTAPAEASWRTALTALLLLLESFQKTLIHQRNWPVKYLCGLLLQNAHNLGSRQILPWAVWEVPLSVFTSCSCSPLECTASRSLSW